MPAQAVKQRLHVVRQFGHIGKPERRSAALDGVRAAKDAVQFFVVGTAQVQAQQVLLQLVQVLTCLFKEDRVELGQIKIGANAGGICGGLTHAELLWGCGVLLLPWRLTGHFVEGFWSASTRSKLWAWALSWASCPSMASITQWPALVKAKDAVFRIEGESSTTSIDCMGKAPTRLNVQIERLGKGLKSAMEPASMPL